MNIMRYFSLLVILMTFMTTRSVVYSKNHKKKSSDKLFYSNFYEENAKKVKLTFFKIKIRLLINFKKLNENIVQ